MSSGRKIIVMLILIVNAFMCFYVAVLAASEIEFLTGRVAESKGLFLLLVALIGVPVLIILSLLKWTLSKRTALPDYYKYSWTLFVGAAITVVCPLISDDTSIVLLPAVVMGILYVGEATAVYRLK